jgi:hypothetical protein
MGAALVDEATGQPADEESGDEAGNGETVHVVL